MRPRFARWEKTLLWAVALLLTSLLVYYALPHQKVVAIRFRAADRVILSNRFNQVSTFVGDDLRKVIDSLRTSERIPPWYKVESAGGDRFEFFKGTHHLGTVEAGWGVFWIGPATYIDRNGSLDPLFERLRSEIIRTNEHSSYLRP